MKEEERKYRALQAEAQAEQERWAQLSAAGHAEVEQARRAAVADAHRRQAALDAAAARYAAEREQLQQREQENREALERQKAADAARRQQEAATLRTALEAAERQKAAAEQAERRTHELIAADRERRQQQEAIDEWGRADMRGFDPGGAAAISCRDWIIGVINTPGGLDKLDVPRIPTIKIVSEIDARMQTLPADMGGADTVCTADHDVAPWRYLIAY